MSPEIKIKTSNIGSISKLIHVLGYNFGEVSKAILWASKYENEPMKCHAYLVHLTTNLSDLLTDILKIAKFLGIDRKLFEELAYEREQERIETFRRKGKPFI